MADGTGTTPLLSLRDVETAYGDSQVLFGISMDIMPGEVVTLLGRNGMGKTTTIRSILGLQKPKAGQVLVDGRDVTPLPSYRIAQTGIGIVPEGRQVFPTLSVRENLIATAAQRSGGRWTVEAIFELFPRLAERRGHMGNQLSGGEFTPPAWQIGQRDRSRASAALCGSCCDGSDGLTAPRWHP